MIELGRHDRVVELLEDVVPDLEVLLPENAVLRVALALAFARSVRAEGHADEATPFFRYALAYWRTSEYRNSSERYWAFVGVLFSQFDKKQWAAARDSCLEEVEAVEGDTRWKHIPDVVGTMAPVFDEAGRTDLKVEVAERAYRYQVDHHEANSQPTLFVLEVLVEGLVQVGRYARAVELVEGASASIATCAPPAAENSWNVQSWYGVALWNLERYDEAVAVFRDELAYRVENHGAQFTEALRARFNLAANLADGDQREEAVSVLEEGIRIIELRRPEDRGSNYEFRSQLHSQLTSLGRFEDDEPHLRWIVEYHRKLAAGEPSRDLAVFIVDLAGLCRMLRKPDESIALLREAISMFDATEPDDEGKILAIGRLGQHLSTNGEFVESEERLLEALALLQERGRALSPHSKSLEHELVRHLARDYERRGMADEAERILSQYEHRTRGKR